jgi:hypothetical protein
MQQPELSAALLNKLQIHKIKTQALKLCPSAKSTHYPLNSTLAGSYGQDEIGVIQKNWCHAEKSFHYQESNPPDIQLIAYHFTMHQNYSDKP